MRPLSYLFIYVDSLACYSPFDQQKNRARDIFLFRHFVFSGQTINMLDTLQLSFVLLLLFVVQGVSAMAAIDVIALIIGLVIVIFGVCVGIGYYARRRSGS